MRSQVLEGLGTEDGDGAWVENPRQALLPGHLEHIAKPQDVYMLGERGFPLSSGRQDRGEGKDRIDLVLTDYPFQPLFISHIYDFVGALIMRRCRLRWVRSVWHMAPSGGISRALRVWQVRLEQEQGMASELILSASGGRGDDCSDRCPGIRASARGEAVDDLGFNTEMSQIPIIPLIVGESSKAKRFSDLLYDEGIVVVPIVFLMVAQDRARIKVQINAKITVEQLDSVIKTIEATAKKLGII